MRKAPIDNKSIEAFLILQVLCENYLVSTFIAQ